MDMELFALSLEGDEGRTLLKQLIRNMDSQDITDILQEDLDDDTKTELGESWFIA